MISADILTIVYWQISKCWCTDRNIAPSFHQEPDSFICSSKSRTRLDVVHRKEERGAEDITAERVMSSTEYYVTARFVSVLCRVAAIVLTTKTLAFVNEKTSL
ncbi:hypothetical protein J6590_063294 [Homalodisca vitripennis]|nr:hypothetical protein J6590_063294 [Homalodisca vitripennis]